MSWWNRRLTRHIVSDCVLSGNSAFVLFPEIAAFYPARFAAIDEAHVQLTLFPKRDGDVRSASDCCVTFRHEFKPYCFVSTITDVRRVVPSPHLVVKTPDRLFTEKRRLAYRVPVLRSSGLIAHMSAPSAHAAWEADVVDLSVAGALVESASGPSLSVGTRVDMALLLDAHAASLTGEVRRREHSTYGVEFTSVFDQTGLRPPNALQAIVDAVERDWFSYQFREAARVFERGEGPVNRELGYLGGDAVSKDRRQQQCRDTRLR